MEKDLVQYRTLEQLKELLDQDMFGDPDERLNPEVSCTGMCYAHAAENKDVAASVRFFLEDHCGGGLTCDVCDAYRVLSAFVSNVEVEEDPSRVVDGRIDMRVNIKGLNEDQLTEIHNSLGSWAVKIWGDIEDDLVSEEEKVGLYKQVRMVEELQELIKGYFR